MAWTFNGKIIREGRSWVGIDGVQHPASWGRWSDEEKQAAGMTQVADPAPNPDNRFWWDADTPKALDDIPAVDENGDPVLDEDGNQVVTLGLKSVHKAIVKQQAAGLLAATDWYVTRNAETGTAIPADVTTYRAAVRAASGAIESAIDGAANHAAFVALFDTPVDADGNPTGNAPIADWPEA
jgi:hypothetical protein